MFKTILVPIDLDDAGSWRKALPVAIELCRAGDGCLHVLSVVPPIASGMASEYLPQDYAQTQMSRRMAELTEFVAEFVPEAIDVRRRVVAGAVNEEIVKAGREEHCDLIVMAAHRPEFRDYLLGPEAARVVRHAKCSVMVVRE